MSAVFLCGGPVAARKAAVVSSLNPSPFGAAVTFTATLSPAVADGETVTFYSDGRSLGSATTTGSAAKLTTGSLAVGSHGITATRQGGNTDSETQTSGTTQSVFKVATTTALSSALNPSTYGAAVKFTAAISPKMTSGGTVTFFNGTIALGTIAPMSGTATLTTSALVAGSPSIIAKYSGSTNFGPSTSSSLTQNVNKAVTTTTLTSFLNPSIYGKSVTFTATIAPTVPNGETVTFYNGSSAIGTGTTSGSKAAVAVSTLATGSASIKATYPGDTNYAVSTSSPLTQTVNEAVTTTTLASSLNPSIYGKSVTFVATIAPAVPNGETVTFYNGSSAIGTGTTSGSKAAVAVSTLAAGSASIKATYPGDTNYAASTSSPLTQTVNKAVTTTTLASSLNPSIYGKSVTFVATIAPTVPNGETVTFYNGSSAIGTGTTSGGATSYTASALALGSHSITASYPGATNYASSTSNVLPQAVKTATTTAVTSSLNPSIYGKSVTITATIAPTVPNGETVTFYNSGASIGTGTTSGGKATVAVSTLAAGSASIKATYPGDTNYAASTSSSLTQNVNEAVTTTTVTSSLNPATYGTSLTFTATIAPTVPDGETVTFYNEYGGCVATGTTSGGNAISPASNWDMVGSSGIYAAYAGDANYASSTSAVLTQVVYAAPPSITSFSPTAGPVGTTVSLGGTNFSPDSTVEFNGLQATTVMVAPTTWITAAVPAGATTGTISVVADGGTAKSTGSFTVVAAPTITSLTPSSVIAGSAAFTLTVTGTGFVSTSTVTVGGSSLTTTFVSGTSVTATVPATLVATPGTLTVTVVNTTANGGPSAGSPFTVISNVPVLGLVTAVNNQASLTWTAPSADVTFNVYENTNGSSAYTMVAQGVTTTSANIQGLANGTPYYFVVTGLSLSAGESAPSNQVAATPVSQPFAFLNIQNGAVLSGEITVQISMASTSYGSDGSQVQLLVDGKVADEGGDSQAPVNGGNGANTSLYLDTACYGNGAHTLTVASGTNTASVNVDFSNFVSNVSTGGMFDPSGSDGLPVSATISASLTSPAPWTVSIISLDGTVTLRTWTGSGSSINVTWDGTTSTGSQAVAKIYEVDISTSGPASGSDVDPNGTTRFILRKTITKSTLGDCVLVFDHAVYRTDAAFITYILTVEKSLAASQGIVWNKLSEFVYDVHDPYYHNDPMPPKTAARLATAISKPLSVFYVAGHGGLDSRVGIPNDRFFEFGRYFFHSQPEGGAWSIYDISIHDLAAKAHYSWLSGNMPPALVFIDSCHSAGDSTQDATTKKYSFTRDVAYGDDFDIGDGAGAFVGWSGDCEYYGADPPPNNDWTMWRLDLWATFTAQGQDFGTDWETLVSDLDNHGRFWDVEPDDAMGPTCDWSAFTGFYR